MTSLFTSLMTKARKALGAKTTESSLTRLERNITRTTLESHRTILAWAEGVSGVTSEAAELAQGAASPDPIVQQGCSMIQQLRKQFTNYFSKANELRIAVHTPSPTSSPGGASLFGNLVDTLRYLGISTEQLHWDENVYDLLERFQPTVLLTSDHRAYLERIDWEAVKNYRKRCPLALGLTASIPEYGNTPLCPRLAWGKDHDVSFYYSFRSEEYYRSKADYQPFFANGYEIIPLEFGANVLTYYPVKGPTRDIDYIFLGSHNWDEYFRYFPTIFQDYVGFIAGSGWSHAEWVGKHLHRYLYARSKIGLNIHGTEHKRQPSELTERTYILAACGVPQVVDNPKLLWRRFRPDSLFCGETPEQYVSLFRHAIANPAEAVQRALLAQKEVLSRHTTFHRAEFFLESLRRLVGNL
jgi:hypothetical protein